MTTITTLDLRSIADAIESELSRHMWVHHIGSCVYGLADYAGLTLTLNDGQTYAAVIGDKGATVALFRDGYGLVTGEAHSMADVLALVAAAGQIS